MEGRICLENKTHTERLPLKVKSRDVTCVVHGKMKSTLQGQKGRVKKKTFKVNFVLGMATLRTFPVCCYYLCEDKFVIE